MICPDIVPDVPRDLGFVYVLTNPAYPGLVKIGKTTREPRLRARELSKPTGVPKPFKVFHQARTSDCSTVETLVHKALKLFRVKGSEFFKTSPDNAKDIVDKVSADYKSEVKRKREDKVNLYEAETQTSQPGTYTPEQLLALRHAAKIEKCNRSLASFVREGWHVLENIPLEWSWHIESIANHVQWMLEQWMGRRPHEVENMVINVPPGSMKSLILNVFAPAWMWLPRNDPSWTLMTISNADKVVERDAGKTKEVLQSKWYVENFLRGPDGELAWTLRTDSNSLKSFKNTVGGWRRSQTQSSNVTGLRFDALFFDDPNDVKDISAVKLGHVADTWRAANNRVNDVRIPIRILIQQRIHEDDLTGIIMSERAKSRGTEAKRTEHLCIPMHYTTEKCACGDVDCDTTLGKNDPRTMDGEILHEERNTKSALASQAVALGSLGVAGQHEQRPSPLEGNMFKHTHWRRFTELPRDRPGNLLFDTVVMSVDATFGGVDAKTGKAKGSSRVCIGVVASQGANRYVLDVQVGKFSYSDTKQHIRNMYDKHVDVRTGDRMIRKLIIEGKAAGAPIIADLSSEIPGIVEVNPNSDKMSRANYILPQVEAGNVYIWDGQPWVEEFIYELGVFPMGKYDDQVDMLTQALTDLGLSGFGDVLGLCV